MGRPREALRLRLQRVNGRQAPRGPLRLRRVQGKGVEGARGLSARERRERQPQQTLTPPPPCCRGSARRRRALAVIRRRGGVEAVTAVPTHVCLLLRVLGAIRADLL